MHPIKILAMVACLTIGTTMGTAVEAQQLPSDPYATTPQNARSEAPYLSTGYPNPACCPAPGGAVPSFGGEGVVDVVVENSLGYGYPPQSEAERDLGNLIPPGSRPTFFQKVNFWGTWMPQFQSDGLGVTQLKTNIVTAVPFFHRNQPLTITPEYTVRFLDGPDFLDVPSRLHDVELKFNHLRRISDRWILNAAVTLGTYADDHSFSASDAFRVSGRVVGIYEVSPETRWMFGVAYLNRANVSVLPVVGWTHTTDDLKVDLLFPIPQVAWRTWSGGAPGFNERWWYVRGEVGGGIWSVKRVTGAPDTLSYSDYRLIVGTERKLIGGLSHRLELGYVFLRDLEYDSTGTDVRVDDTLFARAGITY